MDVDAFLPFLQLVELFQRNKSTISRHIKNVFEKGECSFISGRSVPHVGDTFVERVYCEGVCAER